MTRQCFLLILVILIILPASTCNALSSSTKPTKHVVVVGAGWGGWGATNALLQAGGEDVRVTLLDANADPTGSTPYLTPETKRPFEAGFKGFWFDYPNIYHLVQETLQLQEGDVFTPCTNSSFYSPFGLEATAPVFGTASLQLPSPLGQVAASARLFERLPLPDRASMIGLLAAMVDYDKDEETFRRYDKLTAHELFIRFGLSERLVNDFIKPTLLVGLFKPPEELSAAVVLELLYYYAIAHQNSFDVKWIAGKSIQEKIISPLAAKLQRESGNRLCIQGGARVVGVNISEGEASSATNERKVASIEFVSGVDNARHVIEDVDGVILALGTKGLKSVMAGSKHLADASPELTAAAALGSIDCIAVRLWLDKKVQTRSPANVFSRFPALRGAGGTFFMLDQMQDEHELWNGGPTTTTKKKKEEEVEEEAASPQGSVLACDFYNSGALMSLSDAEIVRILTKDLLPSAVPAFAKANVVDSYVQRFPQAVSWFSPGSFDSRPPLVVPGFASSLLCAGDWVKLGDRETKAKGLCQERAYITGLEAANALLRGGALGDALKTRQFPIKEIRNDEAQVEFGRGVSKQVGKWLKPLGLTNFFIR